jgi:Cdc6-like AAA superfamily ATPase
MNEILNRENISNEIKGFLSDFKENYNNINFKKGIYIYGSPGCGKTRFVVDILNEMNYDIVKYDAGDVRNKNLIDTITSNNISSHNVLHMMTGNKKPIAIIMDEIDGMNNGDKGGITSLIKLIRQKKTKKQRLEHMTMNPIICIGNYYIDKKIRELMKVCNIFELKTPTSAQIDRIIEIEMPTMKMISKMKTQIIQYIQGDLRKFEFIKKIYNKNPKLLNDETMKNIFHMKYYNENSKETTKLLINKPIQLSEHNRYMNETERTIVALLWHENIVDPISNYSRDKTLPFYLKVLDNICFADFIDRITFQNQIWMFNEMSSLMKTFYNNKIYHETFPENLKKYHPAEVRFTKVLTKYSTEYNNAIFIYDLCQKLDMDKSDSMCFFQEFQIKYGLEKTKELERYFLDYDISKLDIKRIYRYLDKNLKKEVIVEDDSSDNDYE